MARAIYALADIVLVPFAYPAALILKFIRRSGVSRLPLCRGALMRVGVFPINNSYYEPLFDARDLPRPMDEERALPGIDWNTAEQLALLDSFDYADELRSLPVHANGARSFYLDNIWFGAGDAEYLYSLIRAKRPARLIEIGAGMSTLIARRAIEANMGEDSGYTCEHVCIEPYEHAWLDSLGVTVIRERVERLDAALFARLGENDILFIDSSHVIRPQGDVLFEYLELLPSLRRGVIVHVHDISSPRDYPERWIRQEVRLWNEQYLLEAFLTSNADWKVIGALNYLYHRHRGRLERKCPALRRDGVERLDYVPSSFYIQKVR